MWVGVSNRREAASRLRCGDEHLGEEEKKQFRGKKGSEIFRRWMTWEMKILMKGRMTRMMVLWGILFILPSRRSRHVYSRPVTRFFPYTPPTGVGTFIVAR